MGGDGSEGGRERCGMGWDGMGYVIHLCASLNGFMQCQTLRRPLLVVVVLCESVGKFRGDGQLREEP